MGNGSSHSTGTCRAPTVSQALDISYVNKTDMASDLRARR